MPPEALPATEVCLVKRLSGLPCAGCGLTHALLSISRGHFGEAWRQHPFAFVFYAAALALVGLPGYQRRFPPATHRGARPYVTAALPVSIVAALVAFGIVRAVAIAGG